MMRIAIRTLGWPSILLLASTLWAEEKNPAELRRLYVVTPGVRNDLEYGGAGILVFDIDGGHKFVKRITTSASDVEKPENIKGVVACAATKRLYFTTLTKLYCVDLSTEKTVWERKLEGGCDRPCLTPDGKILFVPSLEGPHWNVVDGASGDVLKQIVRNSGAHNTVGSLDGTRAYLAGLKSPILAVADTSSFEVVQEVGPFSAPIRPFTVNASRTLVYVNVNKLLGFEIGDLKTGKMLHRVEVPGVKSGPVKRHGCPSHGVGLTPDENEVWVVDASNQAVHVFDNTVMPPKYSASIKLTDEPGWVTFTLRGDFVYLSTGDVIDPKTRQIVTHLKDEHGRSVRSEKMLEIDVRDGAPIRSGDQFGVGRAK
jgi:DNA-binding beta-propeller fold protein YncE